MERGIRIAALSDIHGNIWALEAALQDAKRQGVDFIVNGGDILSGPLEPAATADLLMGLGLPTIAGNHERQLLACEGKPGGLSDQFAFEHVTEQHRAWLRSHPPVLELSAEVFLCHGTPSSDLVYFLEDVDRTGARAATLESVEQRARVVRQGLILCGHSHKPRAAAISGDRLVVNAGSVGLQAYDSDQPHPHVIENGTPHARYVVCERGSTGWSISFRCVAYDHAKAVATARRNGRKDWARWLETGRAAPQDT